MTDLPKPSLDQLADVVLPLAAFREASDGDDWAPAFARAQDAGRDPGLPGRGYTLTLPRGQIACHATVPLHRTMRVVGGGGYGSYPGTGIDFPAPGTGIKVAYSGTDPYAQGVCSILEGFGVRGPGPFAQGGGHGIEVLARSQLRDITVTAFPGTGIRIDGHVPDSNANNWMLRDVWVSNCGGHGVQVRGSDVNNGLALGVDVHHVGGWAIRDESEVGCTWLGCHVDQADALGMGSDTGSYWCDYNSPTGGPPVGAPSLFLGCYLEGTGADDTLSRCHVVPYALVIGGALAVATQGRAGGLGPTGAVMQALNGIWARGLTSGFAGAPVGAAQLGGGALLRLWQGPRDVSHRYDVAFAALAAGWWSLVQDGSASPGPLAWSGPDAPEGPRHLWAPNGLHVGWSTARVRCNAYASPDGQPPPRAALPGERLLNARPGKAGDPLGWVGLPGGAWGVAGRVE